ncbi:MAG: DUF3035 domain-containing protein [Pseudomonadota bacterium]|nr:DUF3035 domain-containing protein [Pseudomonadota bacterium]MEC8664637.1 DUF3035 domain-containing protein [Pseudomonadota bacterium]
MRKFPVLLVAVLALSACDGAKKQLGLERQAPDEFAVVKRAPLEMPPDYTLRPPAPGAQRPQEMTTDKEAQAVVFGADAQQSATAAPRDGEAALLMSAGATNADDSIRRVVDQETAAMDPREKPVAEKLLGIAVGDRGKPAATVVDAEAEAQRLQKNIEEGKPVTEGKTPTIEE